MKLLLAALMLPALFVTVLTMALFMGATGDGDTAVLAGCTTTTTAGGTAVTLDAAGTADAKVIIAVGKARAVPPYGWVVAIATSLQETGGTLHNLDYGDRDSLGLFQQRPSQGWGTPWQVADPTYAATAFYGGPDVPPANAGLLDIAGWQQMTVDEAAQAVQHSAFPDAYARWEPDARQIVTALAGQTAPAACTPLGLTLPAGDVGTMLAAALAEVGKPYVFGASGPDAFDCSGLVVASWAHAGYVLTARTSQAQWAGSAEVPATAVEPGDLAFSEFGVDGPGHVEIVVAPGTLVEAPHTGDVVKVRTYTDSEGLRFGRLTASILTKNGDTTR